MKKIVLLLSFLLLCVAVETNAQSMFKTVRDGATKIVDNPNSKQSEIDIAQFKITALNYLVGQVSKRGLSKTDFFYDIQAVNMKCFVDDCRYYALQANKISSAKRKQVMECFKKASLDNPLFNDTDKKNSMVYVRDANTETPFSLDTDWEKAYDQVSKSIKSIMK